MRMKPQTATLRGDGSGAASAENALGISVRSLNPDEAAELGLPSNQGLLIVKIKSGKSAAESGLRAGDVIISANLMPVGNAQTLGKILKSAKAKGAVLLQINRRGQIFFRAVPLAEQ